MLYVWDDDGNKRRKAIHHVSAEKNERQERDEQV